jgi:hypothetical protein
MNSAGGPESLMKSWGTLNIPRVVVTGMGTVNPLGLSVNEYWEGLVVGKSGIGVISQLSSKSGC